MNRIRVSGRVIRIRSASSRPSIPGMTTSVSRRSIGSANSRLERERLDPVARHQDAVAEPDQDLTHETPDGLLVLDQQDRLVATRA